MRFEKNLKSRLNNQWLWYWKQTWFDKIDTFQAIISKLEHY